MLASDEVVGSNNFSFEVGKQFLCLTRKVLSNNSSWTKCLKNQPCDVIKIRKMGGEVGKNDG